MQAVTLSSRGSFKRTNNFLKNILKLDIRQILNEYGQKGVEALEAATPKRTGLTSRSWYYEIHTSAKGASISWFNSNINEGVPIALIIQYGHGTGWGSYVEGIDYINPALGPIFDEMASDVWRVIQDG